MLVLLLWRALIQDLWNLIHSRSSDRYKVSVHESCSLICSCVSIHTGAGVREHRQASDSELLLAPWVPGLPVNRVARGTSKPTFEAWFWWHTLHPAPSLRKSLGSPYSRTWLREKNGALRAEAHVWPLSRQLPLNPDLVGHTEKRVPWQSTCASEVTLMPTLANQWNVKSITKP